MGSRQGTHPDMCHPCLFSRGAGRGLRSLWGLCWQQPPLQTEQLRPHCTPHLLHPTCPMCVLQGWHCWSHRGLCAHVKCKTVLHQELPGRWAEGTMVPFSTAPSCPALWAGRQAPARGGRQPRHYTLVVRAFSIHRSNTETQISGPAKAEAEAQAQEEWMGPRGRNHVGQDCEGPSVGWGLVSRGGR